MQSEVLNKKESDEIDSLLCPKCNSKQITYNKQGFGVGKALVGAVLTGGIGLLAGGINKNKIILTCLKCGHTWNRGWFSVIELLILNSLKNTFYTF